MKCEIADLYEASLILPLWTDSVAKWVEAIMYFGITEYLTKKFWAKSLLDLQGHERWNSLLSVE